MALVGGGVVVVGVLGTLVYLNAGEALDPWIEVAADSLVEVARFLHDEPELQFDFLNCITSVDYLQTDPKKLAKTTWQPHLEVLYHLTSIAHRQRLLVKVLLLWRLLNYRRLMMVNGSGRCSLDLHLLQAAVVVKLVQL